MKRYLTIALCLLLCFAVGCTRGADQAAPSATGSAPKSDSGDKAESKPASEPSQLESAKPWAIGAGAEKPPDKPPWEREPGTEAKPLSELTENTIRITITMEDGGVIVAELYPDLAPQTVRNFVHLARYGFYDGLKFHRVISGFMIQGGCPEGSGAGNPGYSIWGEFEKNGFKNDLKHTAGVLSTARGGDPAYNSAGSQFFIVHKASAHLDGGYAGFGKVIEGMDVVNRIAEETPVLDSNGKVAPENMPVIKSITVDDDIELPAPEKLPR